MRGKVPRTFDDQKTSKKKGRPAGKNRVTKQKSAPSKRSHPPSKKKEWDRDRYKNHNKRVIKKEDLFLGKKVRFGVKGQTL